MMISRYMCDVNGIINHVYKFRLNTGFRNIENPLHNGRIREVLINFGSIEPMRGVWRNLLNTSPLTLLSAPLIQHPPISGFYMYTFSYVGTNFPAYIYTHTNAERNLINCTLIDTVERRNRSPLAQPRATRTVETFEIGHLIPLETIGGGPRIPNIVRPLIAETEQKPEEKKPVLKIKHKRPLICII